MGTLDRAFPGRENAKDWLILKMSELMSKPMDQAVARELGAYFGAYLALDHWSGGAKKDISSPFSLEEAKAWTRAMDNEDGTRGAHWTLEQAKQLLEDRGLDLDPTSFWAALCMVYSDYSAVAANYKVGGNIEFYIDLAKAFLEDKDAPGDKLARYYREIVQT